MVKIRNKKFEENVQEFSIFYKATLSYKHYIPMQLSYKYDNVFVQSTQL